MNQEAELIKWNNICQDSKYLKSNIKKMMKVELSATHFFDDLKIIDNSIYGEYNVGYNSINQVTIKKIIDIFIEVIKNENKNEYFLLSSDGSSESIEIIKSVISLNDKKIKFICFENYVGFDKKFISTIIKKIHPIGGLHISKSIYEDKNININLYDSDGIKLNDNFLNGIIKNIEKNIDNIKIIENANISFLDNDALIKLFTDKLFSLFQKNAVERKTRIAISNRSQGITSVLCKLIGSQDFPYVVNNKVNKKTFNFFKKKHINDWKIKTYFWKEIFFARRKKANFLIVFNPEGTQSFLFILGTKTTYINSNLMPLMFLHRFYNDLALENKTLQQTFIASNEDLTNNMMKLCKKYKIDFKKIKNNNFLSKDYMLLFWNDYNQYAFGEKINDEFTIYHLLIKMLSIVDYYNNQYSSVSSLINALEKMYETICYEDRFNIKSSLEDIIENIDFNLENKKIMKYIVKKEKYENGDGFEIDLYKFEMNDGSIISIKYNQIIKKAQIILKRFTYKNIFSQIFDSYSKKSFIKKLIKSKK